MAIELYPHNLDTYKKMIEMFKTSNRVGVVQPTGTGKSFLYLKWIEDHPQDTFTVLSPSTEIFTQLQEYAEASGAPELLAHVQMISYQSLLKMSDEEVQAIHPDKMVLDEFHRTGAEQWGPSLQRLLDANPYTQVLGASATPVRYLDDSKDMASELFDRNLAVEMTLGEAVQRKILSTPTYVPVWYDADGTMDRYQQDISRVANFQVRRELEEKLEQLKRRLESSYGAEDIFQKHMPHNHGKYIVFCRNKEHLEEMKEIVSKWLTGVSRNIHQYVSISAQEDKDLQLEAFKADQCLDALKLLFTIDRLNEGLHVKGIDGVIMLRPTTSPIIYLQQMGRALSVGHEKPLIFDIVNNYQSVHVPLKDGTSCNVFEKEFMDASERSSDATTFRIFEDMMEFVILFSDLEDFLYLSYKERWDANYLLYCEFKQKYNRDPELNEHYCGSNIGVWVKTQRHAFKKGTLSEERKQKLLDAGFIFNTYEMIWEQTLEIYKEFINKYGRDPMRAETLYQGINLYSWVINQRQDFKNGALSEERKQKLLAAGFVVDTLDATWQMTLELYKAFKDEYCAEPKYSEKYCDVAVGAWATTQRRHFKLGVLSEERKQKLLAAGFIVDLDEATWQENLELYKAYKAEFPQEPKRGERYHGINLGYWVSIQRAAFKKGTLSEDRKFQLLEVGFVFDQLEAIWPTNFALYKAFKLEYDREPKGKDTYQGVKIGSWVSNQRRAFKNGTLSEDRKQKLLDAGFDFKIGSGEGKDR